MQFVKLKIPAVIVRCDDVLFIDPGEQIRTNSLPYSIRDLVADHGLFAVGSATGVSLPGLWTMVKSYLCS